MQCDQSPNIFEMRLDEETAQTRLVKGPLGDAQLPINPILYVMQRGMFLAAYFLIAKSPSQVCHSHETPQPRLPILQSCARKSNTPPQNWGKPHVHCHISDASASLLTSLEGE